MHFVQCVCVFVCEGMESSRVAIQGACPCLIVWIACPTTTAKCSLVILTTCRLWFSFVGLPFVRACCSDSACLTEIH